jgi:hypothetical protein
MPEVYINERIYLLFRLRLRPVRGIRRAAIYQLTIATQVRKLTKARGEKKQPPFWLVSRLSKTRRTKNLDGC